MQNESLSNDFANAKKIDDLADDLTNAASNIGALSGILQEAEKYISFLEGKYTLLNAIVDYLNTLSESGKNETKADIIAGFEKVFSDVGNV